MLAAQESLFNAAAIQFGQIEVIAPEEGFDLLDRFEELLWGDLAGLALVGALAWTYRGKTVLFQFF